MTFLIMLLSLGLPLGIVLIVFVTIGYKKNGIWFWTQIYILFKGKKSTATVIDFSEKTTNISINKSSLYLFTVVMDVVDPDTGAKYRVKRKYMDYWYSVLKNKNAEVPVIIHPTDNETVILDYKTILKNKKDSLNQNIESDENRLDRLMGK
jgi:hypothetical protein